MSIAKDLATRFIASVFKRERMARHDGVPAQHEVDPCEACGKTMWRSTIDAPGDRPVVRVPFYRDGAANTFCEGCLEFGRKHPEVFDFMLRTSEWRAHRGEVY